MHGLPRTRQPMGAPGRSPDGLLRALRSHVSGARPTDGPHSLRRVGRPDASQGLALAGPPGLPLEASHRGHSGTRRPEEDGNELKANAAVALELGGQP